MRCRRERAMKTWSYIRVPETGDSDGELDVVNFLVEKINSF